MGKLERKLDLDAVARVLGGIKLPRPKRSSGGTPRRRSTYRAARRNAMRANKGYLNKAARQAEQKAK